MDAFSERLKQLREEQGVTQNEFSKRLGISRVSLTHYEAGDRTPDIEFLKRLHQETGVSLYYLLGLSDSKDDALATAQRDTGLSEKALEHFAANPMSAKVINHLVLCGAMKCFSDRAAILHDDALLFAQLQLEWSDATKNFRNSLFFDVEKQLHALLSAILIDDAFKTDAFGVNESDLPSLQVRGLINNTRTIYGTLDKLAPNYPEAAELKRQYAEVIDMMMIHKEASNAQETPE